MIDDTRSNREKEVGVCPVCGARFKHVPIAQPNCPCCHTKLYAKDGELSLLVDKASFNEGKEK